ncbi:MAG: efflux RND transporter periplasmic adaptor subunit [Rheinheimera sp.]|nr:efflux RND transporter periplasmic adaptor subunit [Rheinheimera sp.]
MLRTLPLLAVMSLPLWLTACSDPAANNTAPAPRAVLTATIQPVNQSALTLTGVVRARNEVPVAFQVSGRIAQRLVEAGQAVKQGQLLYRLDPKDLAESVRVAKAAQTAARASLQTVQAEKHRTEQLIKQRFVSEQAKEQVELRFNEAKANLDRANAQLQQAEHGLTYADLTAGSDGVITDVTAEPGQVVAAGQRLGALATAQQSEIEVQLPEHIQPPAQGTAQFGTQQLQLQLRSAAGSADSASLTRQARYRLSEQPAELALGRVLAVELQLPAQDSQVQVPLAALDERAQQPQLWTVTDGKAVAHAVSVVSLNAEFATVRTDLSANSRIITLGTHLLEPGMAVRELQP